jgi:hypothetical protein
MPNNLEPFQVARIHVVVMGSNECPRMVRICKMVRIADDENERNNKPDPNWLRGGPDSGKAPVLGSIAANIVDREFLVGMRSFVETN